MRTPVLASIATLTSMVLLSACSGDKGGQAEQETGVVATTPALTASAPSSHYVVVTLAEPIGAAGSLPSSYLIRDSSGGLLEITGASVSDTGTQVTLATATQQPTEYSLSLSNDLGIGSAGFVGSSEREPFVESALALSDTQLQVTFSERMDRQFAETARYYRLLDPDTDQDVDIEISAAVLNDDLKTVVLTTTPQGNRLYTLQVTNTKARFECEDGDIAEFEGRKAAHKDDDDDADEGNGPVCAAVLRPKTTVGALARFELSARSAVNRLAPTDPNAAGSVGTIQTTGAGAGVGTASCGGNPCASSNGNAGHEEITIDFDVPTRADTVVLDLHAFGPSNIVMFVSSATAPDYDYTISTTELEAGTTGDGSDVALSELPSLPYALMIDKVRVRATNGMSCVTTVCVKDGRTIDPTRNLANFWGIPTTDVTAPRLLSAISTSPTTVLATFSEPLDSEAADPANFALSPNLAVTAAVQTEYQTQVLLTTTTQSAGTSYTLSVSNLRDRARNLIDAAARTASFQGVSTELYLASANALSSTQVQLTFSEPMNRASLENIANYAFTDPDTDTDVDIRILSAVANADNRSVVLTTTPQQNILYQVVATNLRGANGDFFIDPTRNVAVFQGIPGPDSAPPRLISVVSTGDTTILLTFNEPLRPEAADPANFVISPSLTVIGAELTASQNQILLTTAPQQADVAYTVTVLNVQDKAGNAIVAGSFNSSTFVYAGAPETADGSNAPRVVGAASTSNSTVVVTFSKAMSDDVILAGNYAIVQVNVNAEVGYIGVISARFLGTDRTAVELTTRSQNEVTYMVSVTNVRDLAGNQLAAREVSAGVLVDPRTATFAGSPWSCGPSICENGHGGLGDGFCGSDDDCTDDGACDSLDVPGCIDQCVVACSAPDPDGDNLSDSTEQRGWVIAVTMVDGTVQLREVTSNPDVADTDGDGLDDALERLIGSNPRSSDTDGDTLNDYDEYNVIYSNTNAQDTDGDGADDMLEVEFYKTNALIADSDGDGFSDSDEIFSVHRDPRVADLPEHHFEIGNVRLALDQRFTYVDAEGNTRAETISTASTLEQSNSTGQTDLRQTVGHWLLGAEGGIDSCQTDNACAAGLGGLLGVLFRANLKINVSGGQEFTTAHTDESSRASSSAFARGVEQGNELSVNSERTRELTGASISVDVTFDNPSDVAITLRNLELRASTTDPTNPTRFVPIATLVPESTLLTGEPLVLNIGPGQTRGAIVFANRDVFPNMIEDLMRSPRGIVFNLANFDLETGDARNFAAGLQAVRERTVGIRIDKGDGTAKQINVITAGVLDRSRDDLRCAETGTRPGAICSIDADCADSAPCAGGTIVGGFSQFDGTSGSTGLPLDFVLQSTLGMRKTTPQVLIAGGTTVSAVAIGDDVQVAPVGSTVARGSVVVAPGRDSILQTPATGTNYASEGHRLLAGDNGRVDSTRAGDDVQVIAASTVPLAPRAVIIAAGPNGVLDTPIAGDDEPIGPDGIRPGVDGAVQSFARGDDVQLIPVGTRGVPEDALAISAGENGLLDTSPTGDDVSDVVTGYEVSRTCSGNTPYRILRGQDGIASTIAEDGVCKVAFAPHYVDEECSTDADCGVDLASNQTGRCAGDVQVTDGSQVVVRPSVEGFFLDSVPAGDDVFVGPGIPCTVDADCTVGTAVGTCDGTQQVVRVEERRRGQYRRTWAMLMSDGSQFQTDFGAITVRPGDDLSLAFIQDIDRDGLVAQTEHVYGSSDFRRDTDDDGLSDFAEVRVGWEVGVDGELLRRVLPDPRRRDTDGDGLTDLEELDLRTTRCACNARGPKQLFGSGNLLRTASPSGTEQGQPCNADADCGGTAGACRDATTCTRNADGVTYSCPVCPSDVTLYRTDARAADTDSDLMTDNEEVFGYLTGAGVVDPQQRVGAALKHLVLAGSDRRADTVACPQNHCIESTAHCVSDGDCLSRACIHPVACDDVQVIAPGTRVADARTVVAILASSAGASLSDVVATRVASAVAESRLGGDDVLVAGLSQSVIDRTVATAEVCEDGGSFPFCAAIKPGADGDISSIVGGNDALVLGLTGQRLETSDPLRPDTDLDLYRDGYERLLGSSPNVAGDASFGGDLDEDGLTDSLERLGTNVSIVERVPAPGGSTVRVVSVTPQVSEALLPDTDFDGLPDYAERYMPCVSAPVCLPAPTGALSHCSNSGEVCTSDASCACTTSACACPTNPNDADSDGDGISDLDELSAAQLAVLESYASLFPGYALNIDDSAALGTDPSRTDADDDGLTDYFELYTGWIVLRHDGSVTRVFSDPRDADSDGDSLPDGQESARGTDPRDPDTDDDGRIDGLESLSNPLRPDMSVTVTYAALHVTGSDYPPEWLWAFHVQGPTQSFPGTRVSSQAECPTALIGGCHCETFLRDIVLNKSVSVTLSPGEALVLNGAITDVYEDPNRSCPGGRSNAYEANVDQDDGHYMQFIEQPITYESLQSRQFTSRSISLAVPNTDYTATIFVEIFVNCEGSARGICRAGSRCLSSEDCESGVCDPGSQLCVDYCGNGVIDGLEACDDGNHQSCGSCNSSCSGPTAPAEPCPAGVACLSPADCASNACTNGLCAPRCGDGVREAGEFCDDRNTAACGTCNATCTGVGSGSCAAGVGCNSDLDCAGTCGDGVSEALVCVAPAAP